MGPELPTTKGLELWELNEHDVLWVDEVSMYAVVVVDDINDCLMGVFLTGLTHSALDKELADKDRVVGFEMDPSFEYERVNGWGTA